MADDEARSPDSNNLEIETITSRFSEILDHSLDGIRRGLREINEGNTHSFCALTNTVQEM